MELDESWGTIQAMLVLVVSFLTAFTALNRVPQARAVEPSASEIVGFAQWKDARLQQALSSYMGVLKKKGKGPELKAAKDRLAVVKKLGFMDYVFLYVFQLPQPEKQLLLVAEQLEPQEIALLLSSFRFHHFRARAR